MINETKSAKRTPAPLYIWTLFPGILNPPPESGGIPGKFAHLNIKTSALLPYCSTLFRKKKSALSYYGSAQT